MSLNRKKITKSKSDHDKAIFKKAHKTLPCKLCGRLVDNLGVDTGFVTCCRCVMQMVAPPDVPKKLPPVELRRPRGWQFRAEYVSPEGKLYRRGEEIHEPKTSNSDDSNNTERTNKRKRTSKVAKSNTTTKTSVSRNLHSRTSKVKVSKRTTTKRTPTKPKPSAKRKSK